MNGSNIMNIGQENMTSVINDKWQFISHLIEDMLAENGNTPEHSAKIHKLFQAITSYKQEQEKTLNYNRSLLQTKKEQEKYIGDALKESEERVRVLVENLPSVLWCTDESGNTTYISPNVEKIYGFTDYEICRPSPLHWTERIHPDDKAHVENAFNQLMRNNKKFDVEYRMLHKNGNWLWVRDQANRVGVREGKRFAYGVFSDISERKNAEASLQHALSEIRHLNDRMEAENVMLRAEIRASHLHGNIDCQCHEMKNLLAQAEQVATTNSTVLITGETGTGKELLARSIHHMSLRRDQSLIIVNCAAIPASLMESELFGHEKGAYTGAHTMQIGRFEVAHNSTILLDEIGELTQELQAKLLRVLQEGQFERLGSHETTTVNVRVIAATNRNLEQDVLDGRFRQDLFYRLNVFPLYIPPLRERKEDILPLTWVFINEFSEQLGRRIEKISQKSIKTLKDYHWPGNIRELRNLVERAMIQNSSKTLVIPQPTRTELQTTPELKSLADIEKHHILSTLKLTGWRIRGNSGASEILQIKPTTLEARMKKLGINRPTASK